MPLQQMRTYILNIPGVGVVGLNAVFMVLHGVGCLE